MITLRLLLMILAVLCFALGALGVAIPRGGNAIGAGLFFWALATIIQV